MSGIKLTYFKGRGLGESARLIMSAAGVEWEETHLTDKAQFEKLKQDGLLMFGQVPLLQIDGLNIVQSRAIIQYLANKFDMAGKTAAEKAKVNMIIEGAKDFGTFGGIAFQPKESQAGLIAENKKKAENRYLPAFEKLLSGSSSGYFVGDSLTAADILVFEHLLFMEDYLPGLTASYPKLQVFFEKMKGNPKLSAYLSSDKRFPIPDETYVAEAIKVLH